MSHRFRLLVSFCLVLLGVVFAVRATATPRRPPGAFAYGPSVVWTDGTTSDIFQPLSEPRPSASLVNARFYVSVDEATGGTNLRARPAIRYSADGVAWDAAQPINTTYIQGNAFQAGTTFVDLTAVAGVTPKAFLQFGVQVHDNAAGNYEIAHVTMFVEPKGN